MAHRLDLEGQAERNMHGRDVRKVIPYVNFLKMTCFTAEVHTLLGLNLAEIGNIFTIYLQK